MILGMWHLVDSCFQFLIIINKVKLKRKVQPFHAIFICKDFIADYSLLQIVRVANCLLLKKVCAAKFLVVAACELNA
jgi:hypothetical protein